MMSDVFDVCENHANLRASYDKKIENDKLVFSILIFSWFYQLFVLKNTSA